MDGKATSHAIKQYYVAVGTVEAKLATLVDLLRAFLPSAPLSLAVACGARDTLDAVCSACLSVQHVRLHCLHANLSEAEAAAVVRRYRACAARERGTEASSAAGTAAPTPPRRPLDPDDEAEPSVPPPPCLDVLACTDAGLRLVPRELGPAGATLLIHYDLPRRGGAGPGGYSHRGAALLGGRASSGGGPRVVVCFAAAGAAAEFREYAEGQDRPIQVMPIRVAEIFGAGRGGEGGYAEGGVMAA